MSLHGTRSVRRPVELLLVGLLFVQCTEEIVPEKYLPSHAHDAYGHGLQEAGLSDSALGRDWELVAVSALEKPVPVSTPFQEALYIDPSSAFGVGYRFAALDGQRIEVVLELGGDSRPRLFIDLFRVEEGESPRRIASAPENELRLEFEPRRDAEYILRIQSELLRGGQVNLKIINKASLEFPVAGHTTRSIQSGFGAPRDGGRRRHHGVDIFAPRHTPVLAAGRAYVSYVGDGGIGGRVVWLRDSERSLSIYFAHLETQSVRKGEWVEAGDPIGTVGNSGNARTTPTHLHFGLYRRGRGPIDPVTFIRQPDLDPRSIEADLETLGKWGRSHVRQVRVSASPGSGSDTIFEAPDNTPMILLGAVGNHYRVRLPDGRGGFVSVRAIELAERPIARRKVTSDGRLLDRPVANASQILRVSSGEELSILGRFQSFDRVRTPGGQTGWLSP